MALNEVHKYGHWLTIPIDQSSITHVAGNGYMFADEPVVIQVIHQAERPELEGYVALPPTSGGNEDASNINPDLISTDPETTVFASVAFLGVWAFESDAALTIGATVALDAADPSKVVAGTGFGVVTNRGLDGRYHIRIGK